MDGQSGTRNVLAFIGNLGSSLPGVISRHLHNFYFKRAAGSETELYVGLKDSSGVSQLRRILTKTYGDTLYAPVGSKYIVQTSDATLTNEQALGALTTGLLLNTVTTGTGVLSTATANTDYALPVVMDIATANSATTSSTTDTSNYSENVSMSLALPTGTWTVVAIGSGMYSHSSSDGIVRTHLQIDANAGTALTMTCPATASRKMITVSNSATGLSGTISIILEYRPNASGTAYAGGGTIMAIGMRTA